MPRHRLLLTAAAAGILLLGACGSGEEKTPDNNANASKPEQSLNAANAQPAEDRPPVTPERLKAAIGTVILGETDIGHDVEVRDQSDSLDVPTNDLCAKKWPGDADRIARNQDFFWAGSKSTDLVVSNEVVAYKPGKGASAFAELKKAIDECDGWDHEHGEMADVEAIDPPEGTLKDAFAWKGEDDRKDDKDYSYVAVYQANGDLLSAIYVWATDADEAQEVAAELAPKVANRLQRAMS